MKIFLGVGCGGRTWFYYNVQLVVDGKIVADMRETLYGEASMSNWIIQEKTIPENILKMKNDLLWD